MIATAHPGLAADDFAAILKSPQRARSAHFSLHWRPGASAAADASRFGMVVSKRLARTSVRRNLIKRQARALFAEWVKGAVDARDVVLRLTGNPAALARAPQYAELQILFAALGAHQHKGPDQ
jgi:ribonuclease P protein component